jgi:hypothetical protein
MLGGLLVALIGSGVSILQAQSGKPVTPSPPSNQDPAPVKRNERHPETNPSLPVAAPEEKGASDPTHYSYEFTQPEFIINHIVIEHDANGRGKISFDRKGEDAPIEEPVQLSANAKGRIFGLWQALGFLDSTENYQSAKQFANMGTKRVTMDDGKRHRTAEFNWSDNKQAQSLAEEYRRVADQAVFIFDVKVARENQPLDTPKLLDQLDMMIKNNYLSDLQQLAPLLAELKTDEHIPLIARNHADRLLKKMEK